MLIGAALWGASGTDLWTALANGEMEAYIAKLAPAKTLLVANTCFWILGVILMGIAGNMMTDLCLRKRSMAIAASTCMKIAVPVAIVSFMTMLAPALHIAPDTSPGAVSLATVVGWTGSRLDDLATVLVIGAGPLFFSLAGYGEWAPKWLRNWGILAGIAGLAAILGEFIPGAIALTFIIIPFGIGWMIAAGVVLTKKPKS